MAEPRKSLNQAEKKRLAVDLVQKFGLSKAIFIVQRKLQRMREVKYGMGTPETCPLCIVYRCSSHLLQDSSRKYCPYIEIELKLINGGKILKHYHCKELMHRFKSKEAHYRQRMKDYQQVMDMLRWTKENLQRVSSS